MRSFKASLFFALALAVAVFSSTPAHAKDVVGSTSTSASFGAPPGSYFLTEDVETKLKEGGESFKFETEVHRLMNLIINSLYKSKDIFLRELISNASDALDKVRVKSLTSKSISDNSPELKITIVADPERQTLTITDTGIGMTKDELRTNLGTIAKSGTAEFMAALEAKKNDTNLIGQFGVGFYSAYLVADRVSVISKNHGDKQYIWESTSQNDFKIIEDPRGNTLERGTQIVLHLKPDADEYLENDRLRELVKKYSEFINFPIHLWSSRTEYKTVPADESETSTTDDSEVEDVLEPDQKSTEKTVPETIQAWEILNSEKPIWTRLASEVNETDYNNFYRSFSKDYQDPLAYTQFRAEGEIEFRSLLFLPRTPPSDYQQAQETLENIKIFVKHVFIADAPADFLPRWLRFIKGLVDSDDLPLNVSRETLQQHSSLTIMKKRIVGKALEMFRVLAEDEKKFSAFWSAYGSAIKVGVIEDRKNRDKLTKLLRFKSSSGSSFTTLDEYVSRMREGQPQIYFITGDDTAVLSTSPFVEKLIARGFEVLYLDAPIDEYLVTALTEYKNKKLQHVGKSGVKYGDEDSKSEQEIKDLEQKFEPLTDFLLEQLKEHIEAVRISYQLTASPCAVLSKENGVSGNMERIMQLQALSRKDDFQTQMFLSQKKILEINPDHPLMRKLLEQVSSGNTKSLTDLVYVLFESTAIASGFSVRKPADFARRVENMVRSSLGVDLAATANGGVRQAPPIAKAESSTESPRDEEHDEL
ncbi:Hsp90 protein-domain-containing protein [Phlyctochytrium arcticum]|nr:Hsp90 protein-domain-containing protein [Phlyctochytrium arcticum]